MKSILIALMFVSISTFSQRNCFTCNTSNNVSRLYQEFYTSDNRLCIVVCYDKESSLGFQSVSWGIKNLTNKKLEVKLTKAYILTCNQREVLKNASVTLDTNESVMGSNFSGDLGLNDAFFKSDCDSRNRIQSIGYKNLVINEVLSPSEIKREDDNKKFNEIMEKFKAAVQRGDDDSAVKYIQDVEEYLNESNIGEFERLTSDFKIYYNTNLNRQQDSERKVREENERMAKEEDERIKIQAEKQKKFQDYQDKLINDQELRNQTTLQAATDLTTSAGMLGALIFKDIGPEFDLEKNVYHKGSWRFTKSLGYGAQLLPTYVNQETIVSNVNTTDYYYETVGGNPLGVGLDGGLRFWPYYSSNFGVSVGGNAFGGMMIFSGATLMYDCNIDLKLFIGSKPIKVVLDYAYGDRGLSHSYTFSSSLDGYASEVYKSSEGATLYMRYSFGLRLSFNTSNSVGNFECLYFQEQYPNLKGITGNGITLNYYAHNRLKFTGRLFFDAARIGLVDYELDKNLKNAGSIYQLSVTRNFDIFGQK